MTLGLQWSSVNKGRCEMKITNDNELKMAYFLVNFCEQRVEAKLAKEYLDSLKRDIRKYQAEQAESPERRYFDMNSDTYRMFGVTDYKSVTEAEEMHEPITCYPDQIGRWFEISHKFFKRSDGKICGYAFMGMNW